MRSATGPRLITALVKLVGPGSIDGSQFPYETIGAGVTQKLAAAVAEQDRGLRATNMTIQRALIEGGLAWSVNAESDARTGIVFQADPDGSGLADATKRALERAGAESGAATAGALSQAECLQQAGDDVAEVNACVQ